MKKAAIRSLLICLAIILCFLGGILLSTFMDESLPLEIDVSEIEKEPSLQIDQSAESEADSLRQIQDELNERLGQIQHLPPQGNIVLEGSSTARHIERLVEESIFAPTPDGLVPTPEVAIQIAEAVWLPIYGDRIYNRQPFIAQYYPRLDVWFVHGTLPPGHLGGTAEMVIRKSDGQILSVIHTR